MRELMSEFKELRLHGMAGAWEELTANGGSRVEASRWLIEHLLQSRAYGSRDAFDWLSDACGPLPGTS